MNTTIRVVRELVKGIESVDTSVSLEAQWSAFRHRNELVRSRALAQLDVLTGHSKKRARDALTEWTEADEARYRELDAKMYPDGRDVLDMLLRGEKVTPAHFTGNELREYFDLMKRKPSI